MIDIKKFLICDGRPTQEFIDLQVDNMVEQMILRYVDEEKFKSHYSYSQDQQVENHHAKMLDINQTLSLTDNTLCIYTQSRFFDEVLDDLKKSIDRYEGMLQFDPSARHPREQKTNKKPDKITGIGVCLLLEITPQMKKAMLLDKALPNKEITHKKPKI